MNKEILLIIDTVSNEKNVDREIIIDAMEHALASAVKKNTNLIIKHKMKLMFRLQLIKMMDHIKH